MEVSQGRNYQFGQHKLHSKNETINLYMLKSIQKSYKKNVLQEFTSFVEHLGDTGYSN